METEGFKPGEKHEQQKKIEGIESNLINHFEQRRLPLDAERLRLLLPTVDIDDLDNSEVKAKYRLDKIFAHVDQEGNVTFNQTEFFAIPEAKQRHTYAHELGHRLDWLFKSAQVPAYFETLEVVGRLQPEHISRYVQDTADRLKDHPEREEMVQMEAMAELWAYYTDSDGSFKGMLEEMMKGNVDDGAEYWLENDQARETMEELGDFDSWNEEEQTEFFDRNPQLVDHFHIYANLRGILNDRELVDETFEGLEGYDDADEIWESISLAQTLPAPTGPSQPAQSAENGQEAAPFNFYWFFKLF